MNAKFCKDIFEYDYIIGFDLALHKTGVSIYSIKDKNFIDYGLIIAEGDGECIIYDLYNSIVKYIREFLSRMPGSAIIIKEALPAQCGKFTTVKTLQQLAKAHAALDIAVFNLVNSGFDLCFYDDNGVHSISVKAMFSTKENKKPTKRDIKNKILNIYNINDKSIGDDISDSMAVVHTLIEKKWNQDILNRIKELNKDIKTLKSPYHILRKQEEIDRLKGIMIKGGNQDE